MEKLKSFSDAVHALDAASTEAFNASVDARNALDAARAAFKAAEIEAKKADEVSNILAKARMDAYDALAAARKVMGL